MVMSIIEASTDRDEIRMSPEIQTATDELRAFMFATVYKNPVAKSQDERAKEMLGQLFGYFAAHPEEMPALYQNNLERDGVKRCVCDFISGMTDRYAIETYKELFIPRVWSS
jgi:dGTPase